MTSIPEIPTKLVSTNRTYMDGQFIYGNLTAYPTTEYIDGFFTRDKEEELMKLLKIAESQYPEDFESVYENQLCNLQPKEFYEAGVMSYMSCALGIQNLINRNILEKKPEVLMMLKNMYLITSVFYKVLRKGAYTKFTASIEE